MNKVKKVKSHILQRGLVKNFSVNDKVKYIRYGTDEKGGFSTKDGAGQSPIIETNFYSEKIETGINDIEFNGILAIRKVLEAIENNERIELKKTEIIVLKFFEILTILRSKKFRIDIKNMDEPLNLRISSEDFNITEKKVQEDMLEVLINVFKIEKYGPTNYVEERIDELLNNKYDTQKLKPSTGGLAENSSIEIYILIFIKNSMNQKMVFVNFDEHRLFLQETTGFSRPYLEGGQEYTFYPISSKVGIISYIDYKKTNSLLHRNPKNVFKNNYMDYDFTYECTRSKEFESKRFEYILERKKAEPKINTKELSEKFTKNEFDKYRTNDDIWIFPVMNESVDVADMCNALSLINNKGHLLIYQEESHIEIAEKIIMELNIKPNKIQ